MTRDPFAGFVGSPLSLNRFQYADGNPTTMSDHSGLCSDPGGSGVRYCIERYIPDAQFCYGGSLLCGNGDSRGPSASGGTYKSQTLISRDHAGNVTFANTAGYSSLSPFFGEPTTPAQGRMECQSNATKSKVLGITLFQSSCSATNGINALLGSIETDVMILEGRGGAIVVQAAGTMYPNLEVWMYGGTAAPQLLHSFESQFEEPFLGLAQYGNLVGGNSVGLNDLVRIVPRFR